MELLNPVTSTNDVSSFQNVPTLITVLFPEEKYISSSVYSNLNIHLPKEEER